MGQTGQKIGADLNRRGGAIPFPALTGLMLLLVFLLPLRVSASELRFKEIMVLERSAVVSPVPIADVTGDGLLEMAYRAGRRDSFFTNPQRFEIIRFHPWNRSEIIHSDTMPYPRPPEGLYQGFFTPGAFGDWNGDGQLELVGHNEILRDERGCVVTVLRSSAPGLLPTKTAWYYRLGTRFRHPIHLPGDIDGNGRSNMLVKSDSLPWPFMLESDDINGFRPVWSPGFSFALSGLGFGDFNLNGRMNFIGSVHSRITIFENTGIHRYEPIWFDTLPVTNGGKDVFIGNNVTANGRPSIFVPFFRRHYANLYSVYLYMWEWGDDNRFNRVLVDSGFRQVNDPVGRSICGDLDGNGLEEIVWNTNQHVGVYNSFIPGNFTRVGNWSNRHSQVPLTVLTTNIADINYNGYNNLILAGDQKVTILEVEAVRLLQPTGGERFEPGDTCFINWQVFPRPRCDSLSLFYRTDSTYRLDTIVTGLAPTDTGYLWVVPDIPADSIRVMIIAYGPGWQHDEVKQPIRIGPVGIEESREFTWRNWRPPTVLRGAVLLPEDIHALLHDISGRKVMDLHPGENDIRHLSQGVYFIRAERVGVKGQETRKVVIQR